MRTLYLVRHAEPALTGVLLGRMDPPLSLQGVSAARRLQLPDAATFTSTLRRALQTAEWAARGNRYTALAAFDEISYGEWDGLSWEQIEERYPELARRKLADWLGVTPPGGEPWSAFRERVGHGLHSLAHLDTAVLISHQAVHAILAELVTGADPVSFRQAYGQVITLSW